MIGYHYTTIENWRKIKREGLRPYMIRREELKEKLGTDVVEGIWIWQKRLSGVYHVGSILYQMAVKSSYEAVLLKVKFDKRFILRATHNGESVVVSLNHYGWFEHLRFHNGEQKAYIIMAEIPKKNIKRIGAYSFGKAFR